LQNNLSGRAGALLLSALAPRANVFEHRRSVPAPHVHRHFGRILGYLIGGTDELERLHNMLIKRAKIDQTRGFVAELWRIQCWHRIDKPYGAAS